MTPLIRRPPTAPAPAAWTLWLALSCAGFAPAARADRLAVPVLPAYQQECGACHLAYPPGLLPAASWQRLMGNLGRHYGSDASLDAAATQQLSGWLATHAGTFKKVARDPAAPPQDRISLSPWFVREHREVSPATWQRKAIGSPAQCAACHGGAAEGRFGEREIRIPN